MAAARRPALRDRPARRPHHPLQGRHHRRPGRLISPEELTAEWLTKALGATVLAADVEDIIGGAATKVRLRLTGPGVPASVIVKAPLGSRGLNADERSFYANEVAFYRRIAPRLAIGVPDCLFAEGTIVVLDDLRPARFFAAGDTMSADEARAALDVFACLHGSTWGSTDLPAYPGTMKPVLAGMLSGRYWAGCLRRPRSASIPAHLRAPGVLRAAIEALWEADEPRCVIHGDAHIGNVYVDGTPGLLDWQMSGLGDPMHDVAYFLTSALASAERMRVEQDLLEWYLERLTAHGGPELSWDEVWESYRRHLIHGLFWATNADGMYPEAINAAVVERFTRALHDRDGRFEAS